MAKILIVVGLVVAAIGGLMALGVPFGRLPGDLVIRRPNVTIHLPIATSIVISLLLTLLLGVLRR